MNQWLLKLLNPVGFLGRRFMIETSPQPIQTHSTFWRYWGKRIPTSGTLGASTSPRSLDGSDLKTKKLLFPYKSPRYIIYIHNIINEYRYILSTPGSVCHRHWTLPPGDARYSWPAVPCGEGPGPDHRPTLRSARVGASVRFWPFILW